MASSSRTLQLAASSNPNCSSVVVPSLMPSPNDGSAFTESWGRTTAKKVRFKFTWTVDNFSSRPEKIDEFLESPIFPAGSNNELKWTLRAYPKGETGYEKYLSIYLNLVSSSYKSTKLQVKFEIAILNNNKTEKARCMTREGTFILEPRKYVDGVDIIELGYLLNKVNGLLPDDKLTVVCEGAITLDAETFGLSKRETENPVPSFQDFSLFEGAEFSDVTLSVDGEDIPAHKIILATRSPVFAAMFKYEMQENEQNRVLITDVKYELLREMLQYIYSGNSPNVETMAEDLLVAANKYDVSGLKKTCETVLAYQLTVANAANLLVLADTHCAQQLKADAIGFAIRHAEEIMLTPAWSNMSLSHPHIIIEVLSKKVLASKLTP